MVSVSKGDLELIRKALYCIRHSQAISFAVRGLRQMKDQLFADYLERLEDLQRRLHQEVREPACASDGLVARASHELRGGVAGPYRRRAAGGHGYRPGRPSPP